MVGHGSTQSIVYASMYLKGSFEQNLMTPDELLTHAQVLDNDLLYELLLKDSQSDIDTMQIDAKDKARASANIFSLNADNPVSEGEDSEGVQDDLLKNMTNISADEIQVKNKIAEMSRQQKEKKRKLA